MDREQVYNFSYDSFNSSNISVFLNNYFLPDVIGISYNLVYDKMPIYSYNSEFFSSVAVGNTIVQGTLSIIFTETSYFEAIRQSIYNDVKKNDKDNINIISPLLKKQAKIVNKSYGANSLSIYANTNYIYEEGGNNVITLLNRNPFGLDPSMTGSQYYEKTTNEDVFTKLEDKIWNDNDNSTGIAKWDPLYVRLRNDLELDYRYNSISDRYIRYISSGYSNPITLYVVYGDPNNPTSEYTIESIDDVHFKSRIIQINNDGNPVVAIYEFFGRSINANIEHKLLNFKEV